MFPFANGLFRSAWYGLENFRDDRFLLLAAGLACAIRWLLARSRRQSEPPLGGTEKALLAWWLSAYVAWAVMLYNYRYAAVLEFTAPLLLFVLVRRLVPARLEVWAVTAAAVLIVATAHVDSWGRRQWRTPWLSLAVPAFGARPDSPVLMVGQPSAFAIPSFREDARFVHLTASERFGAPTT